MTSWEWQNIHLERGVAVVFIFLVWRGGTHTLYLSLSLTYTLSPPRYAAQGTDGRRHPWGNQDPDATRRPTPSNARDFPRLPEVGNPRQLLIPFFS